MAGSWYAATANPAPVHPPLEGEATADVAVVGGGYTGLSAALHLAEAGFDVALLEAERVGAGASGVNGGQVAPGQRREQDWLERVAGAGPARALWALAEEALALVKALVARRAIGCDLRPGVAHVAHRRRIAVEQRAYVEMLARRYGYVGAVALDRAAAAAALGTEAYHGGILWREAAHLHPLNYALGLAAAARAAGARIHEGSRVVRRAGGRVETARGALRARAVVFAVNGLHGDLEPAVSARVLPISSFMVATEPLGARAPVASGVAAADTRFVVNYWRPTPDGRLIFGGGESYGPGLPADIAARVRPRLLAVYPGLADAAITHAWGGTLAVTTNRMPAFQRLDAHAYAVGGYSGHGVAMATLAGKLIAEAVGGDAGRFDVFARLPQAPFPGGSRLRRPLLALAMTWFALRDRL